MKVKTSLKKRCKDCLFVRRRTKTGIRRLYIYCPVSRRHNQRQG